MRDEMLESLKSPYNKHDPDGSKDSLLTIELFLLMLEKDNFAVRRD